jgi:hypothetical protein
MLGRSRRRCIDLSIGHQLVSERHVDLNQMFEKLLTGQIQGLQEHMLFGQSALGAVG